MKNISAIRKAFDDAVRTVCTKPSVYAKAPEKDFSRTRKLPLETLVRFMLSSHTESVPKELLKFFRYDVDTPSASAFVQQRSKLRKEIFTDLLYRLNQSFSPQSLYKGYRLLAADGSDVHYPTNPNEPDNYFPVTNSKGYNLLHLNALYDIESGIYIDAVFQMKRSEHETAAVEEMVDRSDISKAIVVMDRGYESYNVIAHIIEKGWAFVLRVKTDTKGGIVTPLGLPNGSLDRSVTISLTRKQNKETKELLKDKEHYRLLINISRFDYLPAKTEYKAPAMFYDISFRIVRFPISENTYETILTNLPESMFPIEEIKKLYAMRWGIETSFRDLKYTTGMIAFHTKRAEYIIQEILAHMVVYNFCAMIMSTISIKRSSRKGYTYKANFSTAMHLCRLYMSGDISPPKLKELIEKNVLPVRDNRNELRKTASKPAISFGYRLP